MAHKVVELREEVEKERQSKTGLEARVQELEKQLAEKESEMEDDMDALRNEIDER